MRTGIILPTGEYVLEATVYDGNGAMITVTGPSCNITVEQSESRLIGDFLNNLTARIEQNINSFSLISTHDRYLNAFQLLQAVLEYLITISDQLQLMDNDLLFEILEVIYDEFRYVNDICQTGYVTVMLGFNLILLFVSFFGFVCVEFAIVRMFLNCIHSNCPKY